MGGRVIAGGNRALIVLRHRIADAGPEVFIRRIRNDLRVNKDVIRRDLRERILAQAAVRTVEDAEARAGGAGGGDRRECEERAVRAVGKHLAGVDRLSAADGENHIRFRNLRREHFYILHRSLAAIPERPDDFEAGCLRRRDELLLRRRERAPAADDGRFLSVGRADAPDVLVCVCADRIAGKKCFLHFKSLLSVICPCTRGAP